MIETKNLTRRFGDAVAVDQVELTVPDGQLTGFVGGNGAGKTTTMRMIMGVLSISSGEVLWEGRSITRADRRAIGYMPEERGLYPKQPVLDQLVYLGRLRGMSAAAARASVDEHLERLGLADRAKDDVEKLSLGNQQRVQIIAALMGQPRALILDEPFSGLDPSAVDNMVELLREHTDRGCPVLFSSHQLDLVERLCERMIVLSKGRVVAQGTADELRSTHPHRYRIAVRDGLGGLLDREGVHIVEQSHGSALVEITDTHVQDQLLADAVPHGLQEYASVRPTLSQIYREVTA